MCVFLLVVFGYTPTGTTLARSLRALAASPIRGRLRSARYARLHSAGPGWGAQRERPITEELLHPPFPHVLP